MKKTFRILAALAAIVSASACQHENLEAGKVDKPVYKDNVIHMAVNATKEVDDETPDSKITYDWTSGALAFEEDDKLQIVMGRWKDASDHSQGVIYSNQLLQMKSMNGNTATFEGDINLDPSKTGEAEYSASDIRAAIVVKALNNNWRIMSYNNNAGFGIQKPKANTQTQTDGGVFAVENRFVFYGLINADNVVVDGEGTATLAVPSLTLGSGTSILEFHVWSSDPEYTSEQVKSITVNIDGTKGDKRLSTQLFISIAKAGERVYVNGPTSSCKVTVTNPAAVGSSKATTNPVWMEITPGGTMYFTKMTVETDKATYVRTWASGDKTLKAQRSFHPLYSDIGSDNYTRTAK